jgi:hypothetical protein
VHGKLLTLEELVQPLDENKIGEDSLDYDDKEIVNQINKEKEGHMALGNESDSDSGEKKETHLG